MSAGIGSPLNAAPTPRGELAQAPSAESGASQLTSASVGNLRQRVSADIGTPRRLLEQDVGCFEFVPHDDANIPPERYQWLRFLTYDEIADEFVKWMQTSPRTAFLLGWAITVEELWNIAYDVFQYETYIVIESRNNFLSALAKRPDVKRVRNKRVRSDRDDRRWEKTTVYRFLTAEQIASENSAARAA